MTAAKKIISKNPKFPQKIENVQIWDTADYNRVSLSKKISISTLMCLGDPPTSFSISNILLVFVAGIACRIVAESNKYDLNGPRHLLFDTISMSIACTNDTESSCFSQ